ncbi:hypothetical protein ABZW11_11105 [Nonomuraea sp. NPDC004580]|uniref:hypothetical protein n=1 Tax=Nonomuraea sp. NPDC004580 TaxID=3154552 RepID=UPI0033A32573
MIPAGVLSSLLGPLLSIFSTQQQQQGYQPFTTGQGQGQGQGQQMIPADAVGTILDLALKHGPDLIKGILDLFSTQQQGYQPFTTGQGQGQQMVPADAVGTILDLALKHGPDLIKGILDLFSTQQQGMRPAQAGQGQQMIPADAVNAITNLFKKYPADIITDCFGMLRPSF